MPSRSLYFPPPYFPDTSKLLNNSNNIIIAANNLTSSIAQNTNKIDILNSGILQNNQHLFNIETRIDNIGNKIDNANFSITSKFDELSLSISNSCNNIKESIKVFIVESLHNFEKKLVVILSNKYNDTNEKLTHIFHILEQIRNKNKFYKICVRYSRLSKISNKLMPMFENYNAGNIQQVCLELTETVYKKYALELADLKFEGMNYHIDSNSSIHNNTDTTSGDNLSVSDASGNISDNISDNLSVSDASGNTFDNISDNLSVSDASGNTFDSLSDNLSVTDDNLSSHNNLSDDFFNDNESFSNCSSLTSNFYDNYEILRKSIADCLTGLRQATMIYTDLINSQELIAKYRNDLRDFDDVNALIERIKQLKSRFGLFEAVVVKAPVLNIKMEYLEYIKVYGIPPNGIFDAEKLGNILKDLAARDTDSSIHSSLVNNASSDSGSGHRFSSSSSSKKSLSSTSSITNSL